MRRFRGQHPLFYIVIGLMALGILSMILRNPAAAAIPVIVLGGVFLLYKFPPHRWKTIYRRMSSGGATYGSNRDSKAKSRNTKRAKFRVIPGSKRDDDDEQIPKYH